MIIDASLKLSDDQAITVTASSTEILDMRDTGTTAYGPSQTKLKQHLGRGVCVPLLIQVTEDFATLTSLTVSLRQSDAADMSNPDVLLSQTVPVALLKTGFKFNIDKLPAEVTKRYVDLNYTVTGTTATAGKITAAIVTAVDDSVGSVH